LLADLGELRTIDEPHHARYEVAESYARHAGGRPLSPTGPAPALLFTDVVPAHRPLAIGLFGTRPRCARLLGLDTAKLHAELARSAAEPLPAVLAEVPRSRLAADLRALPIPTITPRDAGPYATLGLVTATDPDTGLSNASVHRMCVQDPVTLTIWIVPGRDLDRIARGYWDAGRPAPIAVQIGLDPAIYLTSCLGGAVAPRGSDELGIAGALRGAPVRLTAGVSVPVSVIAGAEWVIEGWLQPSVRAENAADPTGSSMPEFLGYPGAAHPSLPILTVAAITTSDEPIFQCVIGPGAEQSQLLGLGMEVDLLERFRRDGVDCVTDVFCSAAGGGQLLAFVAADPTSAGEANLLREASIARLRELRMLKTVVLVDPDVTLDDHAEVWWAVTTRVQADRDITILPDLMGFPLDPTQHPHYSPTLTAPGRTAKVLIDALVPRPRTARFERATFSGG
jgi:4-hydroxy-3-polyprenylbenzoate decarboxylase